MTESVESLLCANVTELIRKETYKRDLQKRPTHSHARLRYATGWRRRRGYLKLQVVCRKRTTNYRALLRKITCKEKAFYDSMPPCNISRVFFMCHFFVYVDLFSLYVYVGFFTVRTRPCQGRVLQVSFTGHFFSFRLHRYVL